MLRTNLFCLHINVTTNRARPATIPTKFHTAIITTVTKKPVGTNEQLYGLPSVGKYPPVLMIICNGYCKHCTYGYITDVNINK